MKKFDVFMLLFGMAVFAVVVEKVGPAVIAAELRHVWLGLVLLLVMSAVRLILQTYSWSTALKANGHSSSARELIGIRVASQSLRGSERFVEPVRHADVRCGFIEARQRVCLPVSGAATSAPAA